MKVLLCLGLFALMTVAYARSPFFATETQEIDSSEHGHPKLPGRRKTSCECGWSNKPSKRVVGGKESSVNEFPWAVALIDGRRQYQFCGGSIITPNHVLTAAHCTDDYVKNGDPIICAIGDHDLGRFEEAPDTQIIKVSRIMQHEQYNPQTIVNDVSVLLMERPIRFTSRVGPACISYTQQNLEEKTVKVIGWGKTSHYGQTSRVLKHVNLRVVPHTKCMARYPNMPRGARTQVCTHSQQQGACMGDSGGPLVWLDPETNRYTLVGVVSFGRICASDDPSVFADPSYFMPWIQNKIKTSVPTAQTCAKV